MQPNRRAVLRYGAACLAVGIAGCTDDNSNVSYPDDEGGDPPADDGETNGSDEGSGDDPGDENGDDGSEDDGSDDEEQRREPEYDATIGPLTDEIVSETAWFTRQYDDAVDAFFEEVRSLIDTIESLEAMATVSGSDIDTLAGAAGRVEDVSDRRLEPHFPISSYVTGINSRYLSDIRRHGDRGDQEAIQDTLEPYRREYSGMRTQQFVEEWFPIDPIENRLLDWLQSPWLLRAIGSDPGFGYRPLFEFRYVGNNNTFASFVYSETAATMAGEPLLRGEPASAAGGTAPPDIEDPIDDVFEVVSAGDGRRDELYVVANEWTTANNDGVPPDSDRYFTNELDSWPIYVQRYRSPEDAADAAQSLFDGPVFLADVGAPTFGGEQWEQVFYRREDRVRYAAMAQDESTIVIAAPSRTPIEDRTGYGSIPDVTGEQRTHWALPLTYTWLWNTTTTPSGGTE